MTDRKSEAEMLTLITDPLELARKEAENSLRQFDWAMDEVERWVTTSNVNLRLSTLLDLHRIAMDGVDKYAGNFRPASVTISGSKHQPIAGADVPRYVEEMLDYLNDNWEKKTATHLAAYAMWRLNWIHPFADGNGRTSRMLSYMVLCGSLKQRLPGEKTIPEQISENKQPYYDALEAADKKFKRGKTDVTEMEKILEGYLAKQLLDVHEKATGVVASDIRADLDNPENKKGIVEIIEDHPVIIGSVIVVIMGIAAIVFG